MYCAKILCGTISMSCQEKFKYVIKNVEDYVSGLRCWCWWNSTSLLNFCTTINRWENKDELDTVFLVIQSFVYLLKFNEKIKWKRKKKFNETHTVLNYILERERNNHT